MIVYVSSECVAKSSHLCNSGGLGVEPCSRLVVVATATVRTVRNRTQLFAVLQYGTYIGRSFWRGLG